jgi:hypothetical protein
MAFFRWLNATLLDEAKVNDSPVGIDVNERLFRAAVNGGNKGDLPTSFLPRELPAPCVTVPRYRSRIYAPFTPANFQRRIENLTL